MVPEDPVKFRFRTVGSPPVDPRVTARPPAGSRVSELVTPFMTLDETAVAHNVAVMASWCERAGVELAPHAKTTMAPALWQLQFAAGACGITVATEAQLRTARSFGVPTVMVANNVVRPEAIRWIAAEQEADEGFTCLVWADSLDAVRVLRAALDGRRVRVPIKVLAELGGHRGRTGARSMGEAHRVAVAVRQSPGLALAGVAGYEGALTHGSAAADLALVDDYLRELRDLHRALLGLYEVADVIITAGGSIYFDRVVEILASERAEGVRVVLRSGAYIAHDDGVYARLTPSVRAAGPQFRSAMSVWARVLSRPEAFIAYLDAGRRDLPTDEGWPLLVDARRGSTPQVDRVRLGPGHEVIAMNDQHTHVRLPDGSPLRVGDLVRLSPSHPCTTFDKWQSVALVADHDCVDPVVSCVIDTYF